MSTLDALDGPDRCGRRPVLIASTLFFAICMLVTPLVTTIDQLLVVRFITGFGLGSIMPNAMALVGEYSPSSSRVTRMMLVSCGFTVGAAAGGFVSAALIPAHGWHAVAQGLDQDGGRTRFAQ